MMSLFPDLHHLGIAISRFSQNVAKPRWSKNNRNFKQN